MIRKAWIEDLPQIVTICDEAKQILKINDINQWQNGYPNENSFKKDIIDGTLYVCIQDDRVVGMACITFKEEINYKNISDGNWLNDERYMVIHRIAVKENYLRCGIALKMLLFAEEIAVSNNIFNIKIDTHEKNSKMQSLLLKAGYIMCGIVYIDNEREKAVKRYGYQKKIGISN